MKSEIISSKISNEDINWYKICIVENDAYVVITDGTHDLNNFNGTCIIKKYKNITRAVGMYSSWNKLHFKLVREPILIKFSND